jgi:hypothetical protein
VCPDQPHEADPFAENDVIGNQNIKRGLGRSSMTRPVRTDEAAGRHKGIEDC